MANTPPNTRPKPFVFVLMPFKDSFNDTYNLGIKPACKEAGIYCERVDEQIYQGNTMDRIYNQISKADIIVSDMSGQNPNVFYETGYAHALGKATILLTKEANSIPFDLKQFPHVVYEGNITLLKRDLKRLVRYFVKNPERRQATSSHGLDFLVEGQNVRTDTIVTLNAFNGESHLGVSNRKNWQLSFGVHNPSDESIDLQNYQFGLVFPSDLGSPQNASDEILNVDKSNYMHIFKYFGSATILPKGYVNTTVSVIGAPRALFGRYLPCSVKVFSEFGSEIIEFGLVVEEIPNPGVLSI